jgi:hypothetical protein
MLVIGNDVEEWPSLRHMTGVGPDKGLQRRALGPGPDYYVPTWDASFPAKLLSCLWLQPSAPFMTSIMLLAVSDMPYP